ncbi:MAG: GMC oxidoreductase [Potamolinea sp.]
MASNLPKLEFSQTQKVDVQNTTFSIDALGRFVCSTWDEATKNGGAPFDVVVIGAGMFGGYCAEKIYRFTEQTKLRVLVLEAGPFLVSEHVQNLAKIGLYEPSPMLPSEDKGEPRNLVWGMPWRGNEPFVGAAYCIGGKSLYWGGWCPRLTEEDLAQWPDEIAQYLRQNYHKLEKQTGVAEKTDFITGKLYEALRHKVDSVLNSVPKLENKSEEPPLAVLGNSPSSGLFSFDKFSSAPLLIDAIREDITEKSKFNDAQRRLFLVPRTHVTKLHTTGSVVTKIEVSVNGKQEFLDINPNCSVVLALSGIESTRLALESFPRSSDPQKELMGRNLMVHVRSNITVRIRRSVLESPGFPLPEKLETAAMLVRGTTPQGAFHLQLTAAANAESNSDALLFRMIPDIDQLEQILEAQKADWVTITLRGCGEIRGEKDKPIHSTTTSWMDLSPFETDEFGKHRAFVFLKKTADAEILQDAMEKAALDLAKQLANNDPNNIEIVNVTRDGLGSTYHESGTLWMGDSPTNSVTNVNGRFHHINNAYCVDQAVFPTVGSANPVLTGLVLARKTAESIVKQH